MTANAAIVATQMIQLIEKKDNNYRLQPGFAAWMMSLPEDWTLRPFLKEDGESKA